MMAQPSDVGPMAPRAASKLAARVRGMGDDSHGYPWESCNFCKRPCKAKTLKGLVLLEGVLAGADSLAGERFLQIPHRTTACHGVDKVGIWRQWDVSGTCQDAVCTKWCSGVQRPGAYSVECDDTLSGLFLREAERCAVSGVGEADPGGEDTDAVETQT
ncbi:hypothetical protein BKA56DRAFT_609733 [Ilyonectria sp. MPI-CAGE-AT-0026]|nr:hypothetical protein BKA56DRAFT_609733 [Ilyonectria sp. MPI-CAGE-AT-0026]